MQSSDDIGSKYPRYVCSVMAVRFWVFCILLRDNVKCLYETQAEIGRSVLIIIIFSNER